MPIVGEESGLKSPCPECGCEAKKIERYNCGPIVYIKCPECGYVLRESDYFARAVGIVNYWNRSEKYKRFFNALGTLYEAQFAEYPVSIRYEGIDHEVKGNVDIIQVRDFTFGTDNDELPDGSDINKIVRIKLLSKTEET